jgi:hypothetical protein
LHRGFALGEVARLGEHRERKIPILDIHSVLQGGALDRVRPVSHDSGRISVTVVTPRIDGATVCAM